jgi:hypothetical protein
MAGSKPLPTAVKKLKGTLQKCRTNPREPQPQGDLVEPPEYMADGAKNAGVKRLRAGHRSINDRPIKAADRLCHWPLGRRPDGHASLSDLVL